MHPTPPARSFLNHIENWMVPALIILIVIVGSIRLFPWVKSKLKPVEQEIVIAVDQPQDAAPSIVSIDTSTPDILTTEVKIVTDQRSEALTEGLQQPRIAVKEATEDRLLAQIVNTAPEIINLPVAPAPVLEPNTVAKNKQANPIKLNSPAVKIDEVAQIIKPIVIPDAPAITKPEAQVSKQIEPQTKLPLTDPNPDPKDLLRKRVTAWQVAWSTQNTADYFSAYTPDYTDNKGQRSSHQKWMTWRKKRVLKPTFIELNIADMSIKLNDKNNQANVRFTQTYRASNYQDRVVKRLKMVRIDQTWLIKREETLDTLPLN